MKPLSLTLKGFRGIRDGLDRDVFSLDFEAIVGDAQLVAIAGKNGRGKSTIMDNMTPYLLMPSRAGADGFGGFSYYDHVYLPENLKELVWEHRGQRYRTQIVIRLSGKKRTEAFLHVQREGTWSPAALEDGTVSDGKIDSYMRCVESILGGAETFFTSVFSAQGRRQLTAYKNGEIKALLAELLGLEEIRSIGAKAAETARLLKAGLTAVHQERAGLQAEAGQLAAELAQLGETGQRIEEARVQKASCQQALDVAKDALAQALASQALASHIDSRRAQLRTEHQLLVDSGQAALADLDRQSQRESDHLSALNRCIAQRLAEQARQRDMLIEQKTQLMAMVKMSAHIGRAEKRLPLAQKVAARREALWQARRQDAEQWHALAAHEKLLLEKIAAVEREAGQAALAAQDLARRFGLTAEVPCSGTGMQGQCKLLGDAITAKRLMPSADAQLARLEEERMTLSAKLKATQQQAAAYADAPDQSRIAEAKMRLVMALAATLAQRAARARDMRKASDGLASLNRQLEELAAEEVSETDEEIAVRAACATALQNLDAQRAAHLKRQQASLERLDQALADLPAPFDAAIVAQAQEEVNRLKQAAADAEAAFMAAVRNQHRAEDARYRHAGMSRKLKLVDARCAGIEEALGTWALFAKCMSNDGLIALSIDDAGPTLSGLANALLLACYGPRFTVSIHTLVETAKGQTREGFDIIVHDADSGVAKSVLLMSGGERVWINECLVRAIALYLAQNGGRGYETLFSDEADGPLDADRKRMFMMMKREVLRIGRYGREYFVSQTPQLTAMADAVIDLDALAHAASFASTAPVEVA